ncbi:hypothetical protein HDU67_002074, partial [Dinochytrium kinnereticum]
KSLYRVFTAFHNSAGTHHHGQRQQAIYNITKSVHITPAVHRQFTIIKTIDIPSDVDQRENAGSNDIPVNCNVSKGKTSARDVIG